MMPMMSGDHRPIIAGKYVIEWEIDAGAMGRVFAATQLGLDRAVAIKIMTESSAEFRSRFAGEVLALARLNHRNVVTIYDSGETADGLVFIVMEYLRGRTLADAIKQERRFEPLRALQIAMQVTRGLRAAHRQNIVHRDLKPSNVFLVEDIDDDEIAKIFDFGIAKAPPGWSGHIETRAGIVLGTPSYMAPEQVDGTAIDARADLYALGCVLYQMLTGRTPFVASSHMQMLLAHVHERPQSPRKFVPTIPTFVEEIVLRLIEKKPKDRYRDADEVLAALTEAMVFLGGEAYRRQSTDVFGGKSGSSEDETERLPPSPPPSAPALPSGLPRTDSPSPKTPVGLRRPDSMPIILGELEAVPVTHLVESETKKQLPMAAFIAIFFLGMIFASAVLTMIYLEYFREGAPPV
jgi:serine/threonine protein kinase